MKKGLVILSTLALLLCATQRSVASGGTGNDHGFFWTLYYSGGSASITFPSAGTYPGNFQINWNGCSDVVGGKGWSSGSTRTVNYNCGSLSGTWKFFGVYGWTQNPIIEYYVAERGNMSGTSVGSFSSDGHTYNVAKHQQQ